jgi:hypothetical protein
MENMKFIEAGPLAERKMKEIFNQFQGTEEHNSSIGICICLIIILVG